MTNRHDAPFRFIFMLTRNDLTVPDAARHVETALTAGVRHIGFKDVGLPPGELTALNRDIQAAGATSYLEVVSLDRTREIAAARLALKMGVDCLLGGCNAAEVAPLLTGSDIGYFPFPGQVSGHPSVLTGTVREITDDAVRLSEMPGVTGLDLLAYRAPAGAQDILRGVCQAVDCPVVVAGSITGPDRIAHIRDAGAAGFTIGTAALSGQFAGAAPELPSQLAAIMAATASKSA